MTWYISIGWRLATRRVTESKIIEDLEGGFGTVNRGLSARLERDRESDHMN